MYEDSWYSYLPDTDTSKLPTAIRPPQGNKKQHSLLQRPNGVQDFGNPREPLRNVAERNKGEHGPPEPSVPRRAASYSDLYDIVREQLAPSERPRQRKVNHRHRYWEALSLPDMGLLEKEAAAKSHYASEALQGQLLEASQQKYLLYLDQLTTTERHLDGLIDDASATLALLTTLSDSFQTVERHSSSFQAQCEELLTEQRRLEKLADDVGTDLYYYAYLDTATRRLNALGASRLVNDEAFGDMVENIGSCIDFMDSHKSYRERESYLTRYSALLTKALHLLDHGFTSRLEQISSDLSRQLNAATFDSSRIAIAYGYFEEMITSSYALLSNIHRVVRCAYDMHGRPKKSSSDITPYLNASASLFRAYFTTRDRDLKSMTQHDSDRLHEDAKKLAVDTACRNYIRLSFEKLHNEDRFFLKIFSFEPLWTREADTAFQTLSQIKTLMPHSSHLAPIADSLQSVLKDADLQTICSVVGWLASEYSIAEVDEEESPSSRKSREYAARLLVDYLWPLTDRSFTAEVTRSITKAAVPDSALVIEAVENGVASSNACPMVRRALELLVMFDQSMPKERSARNSSVVFNIVRETIQVLQRADVRIRSLKSGTDANLFMVKNLLIVKNELVSLEIGDIRSHVPSMQHFGQIWEAINPQNWVGLVSNLIGGSLWPRRWSTVTATALTAEDMNEQLDELLRQSIYAFTKRWAATLKNARDRKAGAKPIAKPEAELHGILETAFSSQPEVVLKLKEAIQLNMEEKDAGAP